MNRNKVCGSTINMIIINAYYFFHSFFNDDYLKIQLNNQQIWWVIYINDYHNKVTNREGKNQRKILMKTLGTSKNHSGWIDLIHSSMLDREHSIIRIIHLSFWHCPLESN